jgi:hypothetical protein
MTQEDVSGSLWEDAPATACAAPIPVRWRRSEDFGWCGTFIRFELFQTQFELLDLMVQLLQFEWRRR